ncbi:p-loop containing nucleoside triphosphate hydrolase [Fusarium austroafricanum]|uniref:p-loop containing nucleoside triphosphate hydrolase n=1 Tax=Fusarium austroafricanum TaxID=2364996 RepID=A0A8H4K8U0_9HYPO|nr:p-loop containing nucleoside triphosphate hydrolase [Fusarium austroafricanum]
MDPASIIGTTSAAITFVETIVEIVSIAREVHDTATGELNEHKRLRDVTSALKPGINILLAKRKSHGPLSQEEDSLLRVAEQCQDVAARISRLLDSSQILERLDEQFTLLRQERLTDLEKIRNTLETTLLDISGKSNNIINKIN